MHRILIFLLIECFAASAYAGDSSPVSIDFDRDIQPILASRCLKCHGNSPEAGLNLTELAKATAELPSGERAIVPGDIHASALVSRITASNPDLRMPPEGAPLTAHEIERLKAWIRSGANWPANWAYRPLTRPEVPPVELPGYPNWNHNPIDAFVLAELKTRGLTPSPVAEKRILLRRVYLDLTGLPPTPEELAAFLADDSPKAYAKVVDKLLASPHFGERWARHWMDVVHFAETHGQDQDRPREHAWPYRDYLIQSFNADKPFGRFVMEQIAGDVLFPNDPQAIVATGFLASGPWDESSLRDIREDSLDREIARYLDRDDIVTTVMSTFASSTVHCARCHDHKFDPIKQDEYYALQAVFAATDKGNRPYDNDPQVVSKRLELTSALAELPARLMAKDKTLLTAELQTEVAAWEKALANTTIAWQTAKIDVSRSESATSFKTLDDGSLLAEGAAPDKDVYQLRTQTGRKRITGVRLDLLTHDSLPLKGPGRQGNGNLHLSEIRISLVQPGDVEQTTPVALLNAKADFNQAGWEVDKALDGNLASAWGIYPQVGMPHHALVAFEKPIESEVPITLFVELHQLHGASHTIGRLLVSTCDSEQITAPDQTVLPADISTILQTPAADRTEQEHITLSGEYLKNKWTRELSLLPTKKLIYCGSNKFETDGSHRPAANPRKVFVLERGDFQRPGIEAIPGALNLIPVLPGTFQLVDANNEGERRAALARWLTDERNVLVWRSIANRIWHYHFGKGLVDTPNDFGRMGSAPSHPGLLDWLATELISKGGSLKSLHRAIVTSETYCQTSSHNETYAAIDADNRYLWRMNRQRLDAESIRDAMLLISGRLNRSQGGPSVRQFVQRPGVHVTPVVDYQNFDPADPANYRRSVYRFIFRTIPDPFMDAMDCPDASQLTPKRTESLTALQALAMLNDKMVVRLSEQVAERVGQLAVQSTSTPSQSTSGVGTEHVTQVVVAYRLLLGREPTESEATVVSTYAKKHGWASACRFLLNTNEFMFVD